MDRLGAVLAGGVVSWVVVSATWMLWSRPAEAAAFVSFCLLAALVVVATWRYTDPSP